MEYTKSKCYSPRGRPRKTWNKCIKNDMKTRRLQPRLALAKKKKKKIYTNKKIQFYTYT